MTVDTSDSASPALEKPKGCSRGHIGNTPCCGSSLSGRGDCHPPLTGDTFLLSSTNLAPLTCHRSHQSSSSTTTATTTKFSTSTCTHTPASSRNRTSSSSSSKTPDSRPSPPCSSKTAQSFSAVQQYQNLSLQLFWSQYSATSSPSNTSSKCSSSSVRWQSLSMPAILVLCFLFSSSVLLFSTHQVEAHWQENIAPRRRIHLRDSDVDIFTGNESAIDYFKYLDRDGDSLLVGARNVVYNISLSTLKENRRLDWSSSEDDTRMCKYKGKSEEVCQNYIKVLAKLGDERLLVCGTNAFKPKCRTYQYGPMHNYLVHGEKSGEALCPYDPTYPSTATFYEKNLYVATVAGFTGADPLIYREPLRTEQFNPKHLNAPSFVSSFPHSSHVYFFFRESAVEYTNCGKATFSRVARVCARDNGGPHKFRKARLQCAIGSNDEFPFYFNEIQATSEIIKGNYGGRNEQLIYAVFTTAPNSIGGSAVCAFRMEDIEAAFRGPFKGQKDIDSAWMAVPSVRVPNPRPGECSNDSQSLPEMTVNFVKEHPLMDHSVPPLWGQPLLVHTSLKARFTAVAVDAQIETATGKAFDVLFIGTDNGRVLKAINAASSAPAGSQLHGAIAPVIIEEMVIFANGAPVTQILVHYTYYDAKLVVISPDSIRSVRLHHCKAKTCGECVRLQDPYCSFDLQQQKCTSSKSRYWNRDNYVQNIEQGWDPRCPDGRPEPGNAASSPEMGGNLYNEVAEDYANGGGANGLDASVIDPSRSSDAAGSTGGSGPSAVPIYSSETFALAVVTSVVTSLVFGFIIGYIFSRRCRKEDPGICSPYDDPHSYLDPHSTFANSLGINGGLGGPTLTRLAGGGHHGPPSMGTLYGSHGPLDHHAYSAGSGGGGSLTHGAGPHGVMSGGTLVGGKPINLVLNVPPKSSSKNANSSADNKPMAVSQAKKIYL